MWNEQDKSSVGYNEEMFGELPAAGREAAEQPRPRETTGAAQALLERQIAPGERLLWSGRPQKLHGPRGAGRLFAVFFLGFACFWELMALQTLTLGAGLFGILFPLFGIPFILVGIKLLFPQVGGPKPEEIAYAITDQRVLVVTRGRVSSWELDSIRGVEKRYYQDGTGDLILSNGQVETYYRNGHTRHRNITMEFSGLADVDAAEAALRGR